MAQRIPPRLDDDLPPDANPPAAEPGGFGLRAHADLGPEPSNPTPPKRRRGWFGRLVRWSVGAFVLVCVISAALVGSYAIIDPTSTAFMRRTQAALEAERGTPVTLKHQWVDRSNIANAARRAVIAAEDQRFAEHFGLDMDAMRAAYAANQRGRRVRGASTITQQTIKNLLLTPNRSYLRKGAEAWLTLWAELLLSKERILEIYLNSAQFGDDVFGIEAAARGYYGKSAAELSSDEAAWLAVLLPAPSRYQIQPPTEFTSERQTWIRQQMEFVRLP